MTVFDKKNALLDIRYYDFNYRIYLCIICQILNDILYCKMVEINFVHRLKLECQCPATIPDTISPRIGCILTPKGSLNSHKAI